MFASRHHRKQLRKGSRVPYMSHLMGVSTLVMEHGGTEDQVIAEPAPAGQGGAVLAQIRTKFGDAVADIGGRARMAWTPTTTGAARGPSGSARTWRVSPPSLSTR
ncbi:HD domain-containing protein [Blastococcus sp. SYSU DS0510]